MKIQYLKSLVCKFIMVLTTGAFLGTNVPAQQISIDRIEKMPNIPQPYQMRNWKKVAMGYDSLVFNFDRTGQYLPLIRWYPNTINYPEHGSFGLHSYVGTYDPYAAEAINVLPAVISASLAGIDKSNQNGNNWVLMCEEFFNNRPEENVYLNNPVGTSGSDWWYDTMPNVFFYQLYDMYPNIGAFAYQFTTVADRWLEAVVHMGGSTTPWHRPFMNYRAWKLATMTPLTTGVTEPEAAGAIGWLLYMAYAETGAEKYRIGAEWCLEFLNNRTSNPSYELQLPYGAYIAARMNAEIGTTYDVKKMINWCFDPAQNVRNWGATLGNWGGYDCDGLIGEAKYAGYAFIMNGFEQAGALVPMLRYDDRFARAIGKWLLNLANASRLFYSRYLPDEKQDSESWAQLYDPHSYIAYEAIREFALNTTTGPYATGDAIREGWAATNLALYGASHVGIFGGIIDTTNVSMILKLDLLKTDYFHGPAYTSFLYFNPYKEDKIVEINVGAEPCDLYDAVSNAFLHRSVSGNTMFSIPADAAVVLVLTPPGATLTYNLDKMLVNGVAADYQSGRTITNYPPVIKSLAAVTTRVAACSTTIIYCTAVDRDNNPLSYNWHSTGGLVRGSGAEVLWTAPDSTGDFTITCIVADGQGGLDSAHVDTRVEKIANHPPEISSLSASVKKIDFGASTELTCRASDPDNDDLTYIWSAASGTFNGSGATIAWQAPKVKGFHPITCRVEDGLGGLAVASIVIIVLDFANIGTGLPIAYYPFNNNANDASGLAHHGQVFGAILTADQAGQANSAYYFDGNDDHIRIANQPDLNFQEEISVSFWMRIDEFYNRETHPVSHGSWENRWKISMIPEKRLRWTVKTSRGIKDLDSKTIFAKDLYYHIATRYNGTDYAIYINGMLDIATTWSGLILPTSIDMTIGQVLPNNAGYNFKGVLDEVRLYNYALSVEEIQNLYAERTNINDNSGNPVPARYFIYQNYPNPFNDHTRICYQIKDKGHVIIDIYDILGQKVQTLVAQEKTPGFYTVLWDGKNNLGRNVASGIYFYQVQARDFWQRRKMVVVR